MPRCKNGTRKNKKTGRCLRHGSKSVRTRNTTLKTLENGLSESDIDLLLKIRIVLILKTNCGLNCTG